MNEAIYDPIVEPGFWQWFSISTCVHLVTLTWVIFHLMRKRRDPVSAMLWIMVTVTIPFIGFILYISFGINRVAAKTWKKESSNREFQEERNARESAELPLSYWRSIREAATHRPETAVARDIENTLATQDSNHLLLGGNNIELLITGDQAFPRMFDAIKNAKHHIHVQSFIIGNDEVGKELMELLAGKAEDGVQVRVLYDRFGSSYSVLGGLFYRYRRVKNMQIAGWTMARLLKRQFQINLRNHRKVLIVDGKAAFTGGINLQAAHTTRSHQLPIRDYHVEVRGPIVSELQYTFLRDWYYITDESPSTLLCSEHFPKMETRDGTPIRIINGGPATELDEIHDSLFACIVSAKKQILAVSPYFVPTPDIVMALRNAAQRGVKVRIIVPEKNNHVYAGWAGRAYYDEMLESGVRVYERKPPFMHAKAMLIDDEVAVIGTANLDVRSLRLNYETNLMVYGTTFINELKAVILEEVAMSRELNLAVWRDRPQSQKMRENACSILTPIL